MRGDLEALARRHHAMGERLIALETEMCMRRQAHAEQLAGAEREVARLRSELADRSAEQARLREETGRLADRARALEAELAMATTSPGRSASVWRVLVLDASAEPALPVCRSLGRAGHDVGIATAEPLVAAAHSRSVARTHWLPGPGSSQETFSRALAKVISAHGYDVVVATDDVTLARLAMTPCAVPSVPGPGSGLERLIDKHGLAELCRETGTQYPQTFLVTNEADVDRAIASVGLPVVVKAARSAVAAADGVCHRRGARVVSNRGDALAAAGYLSAAGLTPIVQRFIHRREKVNLSILRRAGRSEARFTYRVLRDVPLTGGVAIATETISPDHGVGLDAVRALERLCDTAGYDGLANGEFCLAPDGRLTLIEVNPRVWGSIWFAERLGQRMVERAIRQALGLPGLPEVAYASGRRFHRPISELRWLRLQRGGRTPLRELIATTGPTDVFDGAELLNVGPALRGVVRGVIRGGREGPG